MYINYLVRCLYLFEFFDVNLVVFDFWVIFCDEVMDLVVGYFEFIEF